VRDAAAGFSIRTAGLEELEELRRVRRRALAESPDAFETTLAMIEAWDELRWAAWAGSGDFFLLRRGAEPVGMAVVREDRDDARAAWLMSVWIESGCRGTGAGERLVRAAIEHARAGGFERMRLEVVADGERARGLYEKCGFRFTGAQRPRERDGRIELEMALPLRSRGPG
jgi:ribosomal protein S18 acetylase RimI-like enzyme